MSPIVARVLRPHPLNRWVLPLGFLGLALLMGIVLVLPRDLGKNIFWIARLAFIAAYFALLAVGMSRRARSARVSVDVSGVYDESGLIVAREGIERVLLTKSTIEIRGRTTVWLELTNESDAQELVRLLDPDRRGAARTYLATTTPLWLVIASWMGIPFLLSIPVQMLVMARVDLELIAITLSPGVILWLGSTIWFARRRRITITSTELMWPHLLGRGEHAISLGEVTSIAFADAFTLRITFGNRRVRSLKLYDPALLDDLVAHLRERVPYATFTPRPA